MSSNHPRQSNQARFKVRSLNAAQERGDGLAGNEWSARQDKPHSWLFEPVVPPGRVHGVRLWFLRPRMNGAFVHRCAGAGERQSCSFGTTEAFATKPRPNPSLERTSTGMADRKSTRLNYSHGGISRMPSSA